MAGHLKKRVEGTEGSAARVQSKAGEPKVSVQDLQRQRAAIQQRLGQLPWNEEGKRKRPALMGDLQEVEAKLARRTGKPAPASYQARDRLAARWNRLNLAVQELKHKLPGNLLANLFHQGAFGKDAASLDEQVASINRLVPRFVMQNAAEKETLTEQRLAELNQKFHQAEELLGSINQLRDRTVAPARSVATGALVSATLPFSGPALGTLAVAGAIAHVGSGLLMDGHTTPPAALKDAAVGAAYGAAMAIPGPKVLAGRVGRAVAGAAGKVAPPAVSRTIGNLTAGAFQGAPPGAAFGAITRVAEHGAAAETWEKGVGDGLGQLFLDAKHGAIGGGAAGLLLGGLLNVRAGHERFRGSATPVDLKDARAALVKDLKRIATTGPRGATTAYEKFMSSRLLDPRQKERVLRAAAFAKQFTQRTGQAAETAGNAEAAAFARSNGLHLQDELSVMSEVALQLKLEPRQAENAYLASLFSDVDKVPGGLSLVTHHEAGARAAAVHLAREFPHDPGRVAEIVQLVKAHQISPPRFMSLMVGTEIKRTGALTQGEQLALRSLQQKIASPLNPANLNASRTGIDFTPAEKELLGRIDLKEWAVPSTPEAWAVVLADARSNYGKPPHKIYGNEGPGTPFRVHTSEESLAAILGPHGTAVDAGSVLPESMRASYLASLDQARAGVARARVKMDRWLKSQGLDPGRTPYWRNTPLRYEEEGGSRAELELAVRVRDKFEQLLREEAGVPIASPPIPGRKGDTA